VTRSSPHLSLVNVLTALMMMRISTRRIGMRMRMSMRTRTWTSTTRRTMKLCPC